MSLENDFVFIPLNIKQLTKPKIISFLINIMPSKATKVN